MMVQNLLRDCRGTAALEYALIAGFVALLASSGLSTIKSAIIAPFHSARTAMTPPAINETHDQNGFLDRHSGQ